MAKRMKTDETKEIVTRSKHLPVIPEIKPNEELFKILCWNVNGLKSVKEKNLEPFLSTIKSEDPDLIFLQETKLQSDVVEKFKSILPEHPQSHFNCSTMKKGYSGTAVFIKKKIKILGFYDDLGEFLEDSEGRVITVEFENFYFVGAYVANSGQNLERLKY